MSASPATDQNDIDHDDIVIPALLRAARSAYGRAISASLSDAGFEDLPRNGAYVLGGMGNHSASAGDLVRQLGVSKQAASALIDTLVIRGYLERQVDDQDRRRMTIRLTERGRGAATAIGDGVGWVEAELAATVSGPELAGMRAGLMALHDIKHRMEESSLGVGR